VLRLLASDNHYEGFGKSPEQRKKNELKVTIDTQINACSQCESGANASSLPIHFHHQNISLFRIHDKLLFFDEARDAGEKKGSRRKFIPFVGGGRAQCSCPCQHQRRKQNEGNIKKKNLICRRAEKKENH
jgi:hypothetical protein